MEPQGFILKSLVSSCVALVVYCVVRVFYVIWWRPKTLENHLKQQGIRGTSYKLVYGDQKEMTRMMKEAWSKPMALNHRIAPRVTPFFHHMVQTYGNVSVSWKKTSPNLTIADPELMRFILTDKNGDFQKPPLNPLATLLSLGLSTLEGHKWAKRRKLITPAFHHDKIQGMMPAFSTTCCNLVDRLKELASSHGSYELDIAAEFQKFSADVISRTAFGSSYEEGKKIFELQKEQAVLVLEAAQEIYIPGLRFVPTRKNKRRYELDNEIKAMLGDMIHKKEQAMRNGELEDGDLLGLLIQCKQQVENGISNEDLIEECKLFYFAGQETTANWLTWAIVLLSMHPNWQEKAREEVLQTCGKTTPDLEIINHLKIVSMVLHEVLRLYPPVTGLYRYTRKKTNIGGMSIPAGVDIFLPTLLLHYDPKYWGDDVEEFKPERFSEGVSKASKDQMAFYPFGWGPRFCLGQSFAMMEAKLALAMLLQHFSFELSPSYTHAPYTIITLQPQHGAAIIMHQI
ncbi:Cytochrome P450 CYP72A219 like [Actinidia chinensis var. chinensis]|uniref:Cytochrome P450 CYP72A219 like n=1 Tax=Actinidia chinensis var. chinensis TaxID=1590841 RepID=A0A2R6R254_ACTCC|nr:Cytochrome P450 CYP72A219 like [Actinidia chinensis var. chinensis]